MSGRGSRRLGALVGLTLTVAACTESGGAVYTADEVRSNSATRTAPPPATTEVPSSTLDPSTDPAAVPETTAAVTTTVLATTTAPPTTAPETAVTTGPPVTLAPVVIDRLWSPENGAAEIVGAGPLVIDGLTIDGAPADVRSVEFLPDGTFTIRIDVLDAGAHTVCVRETCERVFVDAIDAQTREEIEATIQQAIVSANERFDLPSEFPDWTVVIAGPLSGTGGSTNAFDRTVTIHANQGRTPDDFVTTILHEYGHVVDVERLTDEQRAFYKALRGIPQEVPWRQVSDHSLATWGAQPSEDFAEMMVAVWTDGAHRIRTAELAPQPDAATLAAIRALVVA